MIQWIINSFYLRNILVFAVYISTYIIEDIRLKKSFIEILYTVTLLAEIYMYFIFHNRLLYEYLLTRKKYTLYILSLFISLLLWREITGYFEWLIIKNPPLNAYPLFYHIYSLRDGSWTSWLVFYWINFYYIYTALAFYFLVKYIRQRERLLKIENLQRSQELKHLNEQLNPHFLFNALNNIYSHTMGRGKDAGSLVLKLGDIMRYILDNSKKETVRLAEEITFIENYMTFEMERVGRRCTVSYEKSIGSDDFRIVPLILFNFIENVFKHGTRSAYQSYITIHITSDERKLKLYTCNQVDNLTKPSTRTGLLNAERRLDLLYPGTHSLSINHTDEIYEVSLTIKNKVYEAELHYS